MITNHAMLCESLVARSNPAVHVISSKAVNVNSWNTYLKTIDKPLGYKRKSKNAD